MVWLKPIASILLSLSVALAGLPAQASACPMAKMAQMQQDDQASDGGESCHKMAKPKMEPGGCCDDPACSAKCSAMSGGISIDLPTNASLSIHDGRSLRLTPAVDALASYLRATQERPPRILA